MTISERLEVMATIIAAGRCAARTRTCDACLAIARGFMYDIRKHVANVLACEPLDVGRWALERGVEPIGEEVPYGQA
jgi:hypothetical protein